MEEKKTKRNFPCLSVIILLIFVLVSGFNVLSLYNFNERIEDIEDNISQEDQVNPTNFVNKGGNSDDINIEAIFTEANPSVVGIGILSRGQSASNVIGTGFVISEDGLIATNQHVVSESDASYYVKFPNEDEIYEAKNIYRDAVNDIAIVKISKEGLRALTLGDSNDVTPGEAVVAIGNPLGELNSTVTSGIVSAVNRTVELNSGSFLRTAISRFEDTIQTDAAINPGNSGGPLLNNRGEVIGINFATIIDANNLSFAIPSEYLSARLSELQENGDFRISYVGIGYEMNAYRLNDEVVIGAEVITVDPEGSAVGILEPGDIITEFKGISLDEDSLFRLIQTTDIGEIVEIGFYRLEDFRTANIEIIER